MKNIKQHNWFLLATCILFIALGMRYCFVLITTKHIPVFFDHSHFVLDFDYFYAMGQRAFTNPDALYDDPKKEGIIILSLNRNVFHPYPPPASIIFRLFSLLPFTWAYVTWSLLIYGFIITACLLFYNCLHLEFSIVKKGTAIPLILCLCAAPSFLDSSFGNVNSLLLLLVTVFTLLFIKNRYFIAGFILSIAFWIKLYPILLLVIFLLSGKKRTFLSGFTTGVLGLGGIALTILPIEVFKDFFLQIVPQFSRQVITHAFNQSLTACITRIISKPDMYFVYYYIMTPSWIRSLVLLLPVAALSVVLTIKIRKLATPESVVIAFLCGLIPLTTPIGWGYTFVLAYPALFTLYAMGATNKRFTCVLFSLCWLALATPSFHRIEDLGIPWQLRLIYYSRYTLSSLVISGWLIFRILTTQWYKTTDTNPKKKVLDTAQVEDYTAEIQQT